MKDRGIIKWAPFNSCISTNNLVKELSLEKNKIDMPILSEDQINIIEERIITAYHLKNHVNIKYYYNGFINNEYGQINIIDKYKKKIWINNKCIYLNQIIYISN